MTPDDTIRTKPKQTVCLSVLEGRGGMVEADKGMQLFRSAASFRFRAIPRRVSCHRLHPTTCICESQDVRKSCSLSQQSWHMIKKMVQFLVAIFLPSSGRAIFASRKSKAHCGPKRLSKGNKHCHGLSETPEAFSVINKCACERQRHAQESLCESLSPDSDKEVYKLR